MNQLETVGLSEVRPVELMQDQAQCILADYVRHRYPRQLTRFGRLLLLLPCLRLVRSSTVELLFFKDTLGDVSIQRVLADIYSNNDQQQQQQQQHQSLHSKS